MKFKDYYEILGVPRDATQADLKRAYRKLARKYHPDVSKEPDAETRFKEMGEAYEVLKDATKRAAYDQMGRDWKSGQEFTPPAGWNGGFESDGRDSAHGDGGSGGFDPLDGTDYGEFFETLFGRRGAGPQTQRRARRVQGQDHHAKVVIDLDDTYHGAQRTLSLRIPVLDAQGHVVLQERTLDVTIPKGVQAGQHLRLAGQGGPGMGRTAAGDLYLEIDFRPHPHFRVDGRDVYLDLPVTPWEAALGASITAPTPEGPVQLTIPSGSTVGRTLRLRGRGIPGTPRGELYMVLTISLPAADSEAAKEAYRAFAKACDFNPRAHLPG